MQYLECLRQSTTFTFLEFDLTQGYLQDSFEWADVVVHEAALSRLVRSREYYDAYVDNNLCATRALLEGLKRSPPAHLVIASISSVYGRHAAGNETAP